MGFVLTLCSDIVLLSSLFSCSFMPHLPSRALCQACHLYLSVTSCGLPVIPNVLPRKIISIEPRSAAASAGLQPVLRLMLTR